jgi:hypothetical protein
MGFYEINSQWYRVRVAADLAGALTQNELIPALSTYAIVAGQDPTGGAMNALPGRKVAGLYTSMVSGTLPYKNLIRTGILISGSGAQSTLVGGIPGQRIKVTEMVVVTDAAVQITVRTAAGGAILSGPISLAGNGSDYVLVSPTNPDQFHFATVAGDALMLDRSAISLLAGHITYFLEP